MPGILVATHDVGDTDAGVDTKLPIRGDEPCRQDDTRKRAAQHLVADKRTMSPMGRQRPAAAAVAGDGMAGRSVAVTGVTTNWRRRTR